MRDLKKEFENSFKGYHKDAPKFLKAKSNALHKAKDMRTPMDKENSARRTESRNYQRTSRDEAYHLKK